MFVRRVEQRLESTEVFDVLPENAFVLFLRMIGRLRERRPLLKAELLSRSGPEILGVVVPERAPCYLRRDGWRHPECPDHPESGRRRLRAQWHCQFVGTGE